MNILYETGNKIKQFFSTNIMQLVADETRCQAGTSDMPRGPAVGALIHRQDESHVNNPS